MKRKSPGNAGQVVRRRAYQDPVDREEAALTRRYKACIRCRMQGIKCFPNPRDHTRPCITCELANPKLWVLPCVRYKLTDASLFRLGPTEDFLKSKRWAGRQIKELSTWQSADIKVVELTQDHGNTRIRIPVRKFKPIPGDILFYRWKISSGERTYVCPPYAVTHVEKVGAELRRHIYDTTAVHVESIVNSNNTILVETFRIAMKSVASTRVQDVQIRNLIKDTLDLWVASRLIEKPWRICGDETLGMKPDDDPESGYFGRIPVTPIMDLQIDQLVIQMIVKPLGKSILTCLEQQTKRSKHSNWFATYLCFFILLHNYEVATSHDREFAELHRLKDRYSNYPLLEGFHSGAKTILAYFHYRSKGGIPFMLDWADGVAVKMAETTEEQTEYLRKLVDMVQVSGNEFLRLKESDVYEEDLYFGSQLFEKSWQPSRTL
ncbi:hypothetical protein BCR34DRAFT_496330 [Clohesyomyces aquaticus]|uniref:Zn(2)-C6 fungal-type domain-containing protein n=1 Tax=Clohesyomyces aquaticus TaxID=1231657 RepID=A0A1Y1YK26_9PLEO|nr:hypothetical protein BCR34DRAFT_496330 [Clohesyomyces aquaticus]